MLEKDIEKLIKPYLLSQTTIPSDLYLRLGKYLELLLKWNAKTNLTAIRDPAEIVCRHFGESLFAAQHLGECQTLLDFGSGAGFPGLPIQLLRPDLCVTLAESQNKKATFLREAVRTLNLKTEVWAARVEAMPVSAQFDVVTLRAVDNMEVAISAASARTRSRMLLLTTARAAFIEMDDFEAAPPITMPGADDRQLLLLKRL